jgi:hypothetical protein
VPANIPDQDKLARYRAFWQRADTDRPLIGATIATFPSVRAVRADGNLKPDDLDVAENLRELDEEWEAWREVMGDAVWVANPLWAFPFFLAMAGCPIQRDEENLWGLPCLDDYSQLDRIQFDRSNPWFQKLAEFTRAVAEHGRGRYPVGCGQLMLGPVDTMMQVRGQERLALDMHDAPEMVEELGRRCVKLCIDALDALYELVPRYLGGYAGTIRYFWAPDRLAETAEDASFLMSPAAHRRFVLPLHQGIGRSVPHTIVHLHSAQLHTVSNLLEAAEIAAIQITPDFGEDMHPHFGTMARILERKPLIVHGVMPAATIRDMIGTLPANGLCIFARCDTPAEAAKLLSDVLD